MRLPLSVRLDGPDGSLQLTRQVTNLRFGSSSPGGYAGVEFDLVRPIEAPLLAQFTDLLVFDTETGEQVGGGRLTEQGRRADASQLVWSIVAQGEGMASMQDRQEPYFLIDNSLDQWRTLTRNRKRLSASSGVAPKGGNDNDAFVFQADDGTVSTNSGLIIHHRGPIVTRGKLGGFSFRHDSGGNSTGLRVRGRAYADGLGSSQVTTDDAWSTTMSARRYAVCGTDFSVNAVAAAVHWFYDGAGFTAGDGTWSAMYYPRVSAQRLGRDRAPITGSAYLNDYVLAHEAFIDVIAKFCPRLDIANAVITDGAQQMSQLAWYSGVTPLDVMEDVLAQESALTWHVWDKQANGLWQTELVALDERVRYEASVIDGFDAPSPTSEIFDRVLVAGKTENGKDTSVLRTQTVPELSAVGITRSRTIEQGSEVWSASGAGTTGDRFLADHKVAPNAGTLTIARRVYDNFTGRWVPPWRIRAGELIRYRGVYASRDTLNTTSPDGVTVSRIVATEFSEASGSVSLELDSYTLTEKRALAKLLAARPRGK